MGKANEASLATCEVEELKRQLHTYSCPCSRGRHGECQLPTHLRDCACWQGNYESCRALANGEYRILSGVRVVNTQNTEDESRSFNVNHCHRENGLQAWAFNARRDPFLALPEYLKGSLGAINGVDCLLFGEVLQISRKIGEHLRRRDGYLDPRTGRDYGKWPRLFNGVEIRDPGDCTIRGTVLDEVQDELDRAGLTAEQQARYYSAALEVQECRPPSFDYPAEILGEGFLEEDMLSVGLRELEEHRASLRSDIQPSKWEEATKEFSDLLFGKTDLQKTVYAKFPFKGTGKGRHLLIPSPSRYDTDGIHGLYDATGKGLGRREIVEALGDAGMNANQRQRYMVALYEVRAGAEPSFDYRDVLADTPTLSTQKSLDKMINRTDTRRNLDEDKRSARAEKHRETVVAKASSRSRTRSLRKTPQREEYYLKQLSNSARLQQKIAQSGAATTSENDGGPHLSQEKTGIPLPRRSARLKRGAQEAFENNGGVLESTSPKRVRSNPLGEPSRQAREAAEKTPENELQIISSQSLVTKSTYSDNQTSAQGPASNTASSGITAKGSDRSIWPDREGLGRYPAYIKRKGVKHMDDAIKYIDHGRPLRRACEMNDRLEHPFGANELFIAENGKRCSYCTSRNFGPRQCNLQFVGKSRKDESRHN